MEFDIGRPFMLRRLKVMLVFISSILWVVLCVERRLGTPVISENLVIGFDYIKDRGDSLNKIFINIDIRI